MQYMSIEQYEAWRARWAKRPHSRINEGKVTRNGKIELMSVQAAAPGFRSEAIVVIHEVETV